MNTKQNVTWKYYNGKARQVKISFDVLHKVCDEIHLTNIVLQYFVFVFIFIIEME